MKRYKVGVTINRVKSEWYTIVVDAKNEDEAIEKADRQSGRMISYHAPSDSVEDKQFSVVDLSVGDEGVW